jgi:hypothetical protein
MLGRRREQVLIITGLLALNISLSWFLGQLWKDYRANIRWLAGVEVQRASTRAVVANQAGQPPSVVEIVDRNVFSPLRGNQPAQPLEEAKVPKLPYLFGTMDLGNGRFALMSPGDQVPAVSKRVLPGEEIGGYKLVSIGISNVVLEWQEKKITLEITEPASSSPGGLAGVTTASPVAGAPAGNAASSVTTVGADSGGGASAAAARLSPPGAPPDAPPGTVIGGKRKVLVPTPFGMAVQWKDVGPSTPQAPQQNAAPNK